MTSRRLPPRPPRIGRFLRPRRAAKGLGVHFRVLGCGPGCRGFWEPESRWKCLCDLRRLPSRRDESRLSFSSEWGGRGRLGSEPRAEGPAWAPGAAESAARRQRCGPRSGGPGLPGPRPVGEAKPAGSCRHPKARSRETGIAIQRQETRCLSLGIRTFFYENLETCTSPPSIPPRTCFSDG